MRRALEALLAVLVAAIALPVATVEHSVAPSGPTPVEVAQFNQAIADATWEALPLRQRGDRPDVELRVPIAEAEWPTVFGQCLGDAGYAGGVSSNGDGAFVPEVTQPDQQFDDDMLLAFYRCVVVHPRAFTSRSFFSSAQIDYLYRHFDRWLVPCLITHGYGVNSAPSYETFVELRGGWSPLWGMSNPAGHTLDSGADYSRAVQLCGPDFIGIY